MGRPQRNDVDYFPFYCKQGGSTEYIETTYGNDGFAVWVKILRELATTNYHYLNLSVRQRAMTFSSKCRVSEDLLFRIIDDLVELGEFDAELWRENRIVWSKKFTDSIEDAYKKRRNKIVKRQELLNILADLGIRKHADIDVNSDGYPQRKEKKSKEEKSKGETRAREDVIEVVSRGTDSVDDLLGDVLLDEGYRIMIEKNFPGADLAKSFRECWTYHSAGPSPPEHIWQWRQKFTTWLSIERQRKQPNERTTRTLESTGPQPGKDYSGGF